MVHITLIKILLIFIVNLSLCINKLQIPKKGNEQKINTKTYDENEENKNSIYSIIRNSGDKLWYPRDDKEKLSAFSSLWHNYYDCSIRSLNRLTRHGQVPSTILMVYVGAVARLLCSVCAPPVERNILVWMYAKLPPANETYKLLENNERTILNHNHLYIYNVKFEDAGMYRCQIGDSNSLTVLEVVDTEEKYTLVKPSTSRGPYESPPFSLNYDLMMFTSWSPWSECSVCGKIGRRRRYGMCYLKLGLRERPRRTNDNYNAEENGNIILDKNAIDLFETFPEGIPCRSRFLPSSLKHVATIKQRTNEIMISLCKVPCNAIIFKVKSSNGTTLETANNTAGIYSIQQVLPKQPPMAARDTIFAHFGHHLTIRCPGTTLSDVPLTWRFGTRLMVPKDVYKATGGRMYVNSRDHLVITKVLNRDTNLYSCWQRDKLSGAVQLLVYYGQARATTRPVLLALVALIALLLVLGERVWRSLHRPITTHYVIA